MLQSLIVFGWTPVNTWQANLPFCKYCRLTPCASPSQIRPYRHQLFSKCDQCVMFAQLHGFLDEEHTHAPHELEEKRERHLTYVKRARDRMRERAEHARSHRDAVLMVNIDGMDQAIGQVLDTLDQEGIADNTIVLFGSGMGYGGTHSNRNLPIMVAGGVGLLSPGPDFDSVCEHGEFDAFGVDKGARRMADDLNLAAGLEAPSEGGERLASDVDHACPLRWWGFNRHI